MRRSLTTENHTGYCKFKRPIRAYYSLDLSFTNTGQVTLHTLIDTNINISINCTNIKYRKWKIFPVFSRFSPCSPGFAKRLEQSLKHNMLQRNLTRSGFHPV